MKKILKIFILLSSVLPLISFAVTAAEFQQFIKGAPAKTCTAFQNNPKISGIMQANNITYDKCVELLTKSAEKCLAQYSSQLPSSFDEQTIKKWSGILGSCAGEDFSKANLTKGN